MSFFDEIGDKLQKGGNEVAQRTKDLTEIMKLNSQVSDEKRLIDSIIKDIGSDIIVCFDDISQAELDADLSTCTDESKTVSMKNWKDVYAKVNDIKKHQATIEEYTAKIASLKKLVKCPSCGTMIDSDEKFCHVCGFKMPDIVKPEEVPPVKPGCCKVCGAKLKTDSQFCSSCGAKIEIPPAASEDPAEETPVEEAAAEETPADNVPFEKPEDNKEDNQQ